MKKPTAREVIKKAIMRHAGLSDWDEEVVYEEVDAILSALKKEQLEIYHSRVERVKLAKL